ncbi:hypothetical protein COCVIDRAFT_84890 [Bipolaris victoriae FI3]|uniref:Uncharacterized protein n=1 Tax=Bipolaris victoriae (strain FI3) TaxID=930091 RepID=W7F9Y8_BIPV3|nr:hypothetical protein COCVIDRAFT_84890 [Bipolaris victoriae FI3]
MPKPLHLQVNWHQRPRLRAQGKTLTCLPRARQAARALSLLLTTRRRSAALSSASSRTSFPARTRTKRFIHFVACLLSSLVIFSYRR